MYTPSCHYDIQSYSILYQFKALSSIFPAVVHLRFISLLVYLKAVHARMKSLQANPMTLHKSYHCMIYVTGSTLNDCIHCLDTQLHYSHGSKIYIPNGCAPKINIIAGVPSGCVHKICITVGVSSSCVHRIYITASLPYNSKFFTAYPISHYPRQ